jgi:hypothetical protein
MRDKVRTKIVCSVLCLRIINNDPWFRIPLISNIKTGRKRSLQPKRKHNESNCSINMKSYTYSVLINKYILSSTMKQNRSETIVKNKIQRSKQLLAQTTINVTQSMDSMHVRSTQNGSVLRWIPTNKIHTTSRFLWRYIHRSIQEQHQLNLSREKQDIKRTTRQSILAMQWSLSSLDSFHFVSPIRIQC